MSKELSPTFKLAAKTLHATFQILKERDGEATSREIMNEIEKRVTFTDWEKETYESGGIRWQKILLFFTIGCVKGGFIIKKKGVWYLTPEGEKAYELGEIGLLEASRKEYAKWAQERETSKMDDEDMPGKSSDQAIEATLDEVEQKAIEGIKEYIRLKNAYEFQDLVAALLRAMGYYTPFVAPKGKDGGIDIMAYKDPLGTETPRMKVQVKHRPDTASSVGEIRELMGLLQKDGDVGIFVSTGGFTSDAKMTARSAGVHIELVDLTRLIGLWEEFYSKMDDEEKAMLPLIPINFLAPE